MYTPTVALLPLFCPFLHAQDTQAPLIAEKLRENFVQVKENSAASGEVESLTIPLDEVPDESEFIASKTVQCRGDGSMKVTLGFQDNISIFDVYAGDCFQNDDQLTVDDLPNGEKSLVFNPFECGVNSERDALDFSTYSSTINIEFDVSIQDKGMNLVVNKFKIEANCTFEETYGVDTKGAGYDEKHGGFVAEDGLSVVGDPIEFNITLYSDETYSSPIMEFPTTAGIDLFYGIHPIANSAFDPETMDFAPMKCDFVEYNESGDPSQSYTMFDLTVDPTSCENTPIKLQVQVGDLTSSSDVNQWRFKHILFLFSGKGGDYNLVCDVVVCDKALSGDSSTDESKCKKARASCGGGQIE